MARRPAAAFDNLIVGRYDYDPFASFLPFPVIMIRQDIDAMIAKAFELSVLPPNPPQIVLIQPELVQPRSALKGPLDSLSEKERT